MNATIIALFFSLFTSQSVKANSVKPENLILGKWMSTEKNLIVQVYKEGNEFRAKIFWFRTNDDPSRPMDARVDSKNPDQSLRNRKLLGMDILKGLKYDPKTKRWEDGLIYDALNGREWSSVVYFDGNGQLKVKGYWHFEFISKTLTFNRIVN